MAYIHLYKNNPTANGTDGTLVSENDTEINPIVIGPLDASTNEESAALKLAVRCEVGYETTGSTTITPVGTTAAKWALAPDNNGTPGTFGDYGAGLTITDVIGDSNYIFWTKAKATSDENPQNDISVNFQISTTITAA